jgi:hypothetical protein
VTRDVPRRVGRLRLRSIYEEGPGASQAEAAAARLRGACAGAGGIDTARCPDGHPPATNRARSRRSRRPVWTAAAQGRPPPRRCQPEYPPRRGWCRCALLLPAPAGKYASRLEALAKRARARKLGLWRACPRAPYSSDKGIASGDRSTVWMSRGASSRENTRVPRKRRGIFVAPSAVERADDRRARLALPTSQPTRNRHRSSSTALTAKSASSGCRHA